MRLQYKIPLVLLATGVLPALLAVLVYSSLFFDQARQAAQEHMRDLVASAVNRLDEYQRTAAREFNALATGLLPAGTPQAVVSAQLAQNTYAYPYFKSLLWVSPAGVVLAASDPAHSGSILATLYPELGDNFDAALRGSAGRLQVSNLDDTSVAERERLHGAPGKRQLLSLQYLLRVDDNRGQARGVLVAELATEPLLAALEDLASRTPGVHSVALVNQHAQVLLSTKADLQPLAAHPLARRLPAQPEDQAITSLIVDDAGLRLVVASGQTLGLGGNRTATWRILASAQERVVTARARHTIVGYGLAAVVFIALLGVVGWRLSRRLIARLDQLARASARLASGQDGVLIAPDGQDEIGDLGRAYNAMAQDLNRLLAQRTQDAARLAELTDSLTVRNVTLQQHNRDVTLVSNMTALLQSCNSLEEAGTVVQRFAVQAFGDSAGAVYLYKASHDFLDTLACWGTPLPCSSLTDADCWALRRGKTHVTSTDSVEPRCQHVGDAVCTLCIPLNAQGTAIGLLFVNFETPEQTQAQTQMAASFAEHLALALANLMLRDTLRQQSIMDALTGLYNRRFLEDALPRELARAQRAEQALAVFMLDVDHFKKFNDQYGHEAGDAVLRALGRAMKSTCRSGDLACRFGGEEFTVILPATELQPAREWGERLLRTVRAMEVKSGNVVLPHIAISMGLALYPVHGEDMETLLQAADLALYDAKHTGRDRLVVHGETAPTAPTSPAT